MDSKTKDKFDILLISNNPLSRVENNGKTLLSYFKDWDDINLTQMWFRPELPDAVCVSGDQSSMTFYQLTDRMVLQCSPGKHYEFSEKDVLQHEDKNQVQKVSSLYRSPVRMNALLKLLRELPWKIYNFSKHNEHFIAQLMENKPDAIFFCGGDALFAYHIACYLGELLAVPLILYMTDDYILPYKHLSPFSHLRRHLLRKTVLRCVDQAAKVFTIGSKMQNTYAERYGIASHCLVNISEDHYSSFDRAIKWGERYTWKIVFAGGLHYGRDRSLQNVVTAIQKINQEVDFKAFDLSIYSYTELSRKRLAVLNSSCSAYKGRIGAEEVDRVLREADILLFVESSNKRAVKSTALSLSTKVPEYQSYNRPILTIGSTASASVDYLKNFSMQASDNPADIYQTLKRIYGDPGSLTKWAAIAYANFQSHHRPDRVKQVFRSEMMETMSSDEN